MKIDKFMDINNNPMYGLIRMSEPEIKKLNNALNAYFGENDDKINVSMKKLFLDFAKKYYPSHISYLALELAGEYNDSSYNCTLAYISAFDDSDNEVPILRGKEREARLKMREFAAPVQTVDNVDELEVPIIINIKPEKLPELYIKY